MMKWSSGDQLARRGRAAVIGGSIAGLLAARVLIEHFDAVTVIERDSLPSGPAPRKGTPQAAHLHGLMHRGLDILDALFPGVRAELVAHGAPIVDLARDVRWLTPTGWAVPFRSNLQLLTCSRDLLEWCIRQRLAAEPRVSWRERCDAVGIVLDRTGRCAAGVRIQVRGEAHTAPEIVEADLVIDASGRGSRLPSWLVAAGYPAPREIVVDALLGYASRLYRFEAGCEPPWKGARIQFTPPDSTRGAVMLPLEDGRWLLTLSGIGGDYPPTDEQEYLAFARSLRSSIVYDAIRHATPISRISGFRATESRWRAYERLRRRPEALVALGDAVCTLNPVYAQGMTTAALAAETLDRLLRRQRGRDLGGFSGRFQRAVARVNFTPWMLTTTADLRMPGTLGKPGGALTRAMQWYVGQVIRLTSADAGVRLRFLEVMQMLRAPSELLQPAIARKVLIQCISGARTTMPGTQLSVPAVSPACARVGEEKEVA